MIPLFFIFAAILGCGSPSGIVLPEYEGQKLTAHVLLVQYCRPAVVTADDVPKDLSKRFPEEQFRRDFQTQFPNMMRHFGRIDSVVIVDSLKGTPLSSQELALDSKVKLCFQIPPVGSKASPDSGNADYAIILSNYQIFAKTTTFEHPVGEKLKTYVQTPGGALEHRFQFIVWDNVKGRLVAYGQVNGENAFVRDDWKAPIWDGCFVTLVEDLLRETPFYQYIPR